MRALADYSWSHWSIGVWETICLTHCRLAGWVIQDSSVLPYSVQQLARHGLTLESAAIPIVIRPRNEASEEAMVETQNKMRNENY